MRTAAHLIAASLLLSCGPSPVDPAQFEPCAKVQGSCLSLTLDGKSDADPAIDSADFFATLKSGEVREGYFAGKPCALPCKVQLQPPPGVASGAELAQLRVQLNRNGKPLLLIDLPLDKELAGWPDGSHRAIRYWVGMLP
jgi:hypothetical protein